jgi:MFS family permease
MATATSTPLFLFTLPAGVVADAVNRRALIIGAVLWQGTCSALLAAGAWTKVISTHSVLGCIFALGIGLAFSGPVWAAIVPDVVSKDELASAVTLGGVQLNIAAIVGPPLGGFLLPFLGIPVLFLISALAFLVVALVLLQWKQRRTQSSGPCESVKESLINLLRHAHNSSRIKMILFRNFLFSLVISVVPSLLPVIAFQELQCSAAQLGLFFTSVGIGSLAGAPFVLPSLRQRMSPNSIILIAMAILVSVARRDDRHAYAACRISLLTTCRRGLGTGGFRALARWAARYPGVVARTNGCVPYCDRAGRHRARVDPPGNRRGKLRS